MIGIRYPVRPDVRINQSINQFNRGHRYALFGIVDYQNVWSTSIWEAGELAYMFNIQLLHQLSFYSP